MHCKHAAAPCALQLALCPVITVSVVAGVLTVSTFTSIIAVTTYYCLIMYTYYGSGVRQCVLTDSVGWCFLLNCLRTYCACVFALPVLLHSLLQFCFYTCAYLLMLMLVLTSACLLSFRLPSILMRSLDAAAVWQRCAACSVCSMPLCLLPSY